MNIIPYFSVPLVREKAINQSLSNLCPKFIYTSPKTCIENRRDRDSINLTRPEKLLLEPDMGSFRIFF